MRRHGRRRIVAASALAAVVAAGLAVHGFVPTSAAGLDLLLSPARRSR